jgi:hypothetical protein
MEKVQFQEHIYTSSKARAGYYTFQKSEEISKELTEKLKSNANYSSIVDLSEKYKTAEEIEEHFPVDFSYRVIDDKHVIARSEYLGRDRHSRSIGNRPTRTGNCMSHSLVTDDLKGASLWQIMEEIPWKRRLTDEEDNTKNPAPFHIPEDSPSGSLEINPQTAGYLEETKAFLAKGDNAAKMKEIIAKTLKGEKMVIVDGKEDLIQWMKIFTLSFPPHLTHELSFSAYRKDLNGSQFNLTGTIPENKKELKALKNRPIVEGKAVENAYADAILDVFQNKGEAEYQALMTQTEQAKSLAELENFQREVSPPPSPTPVPNAKETLKAERIAALQSIIQPWFVRGVIKEAGFPVNSLRKTDDISYLEALHQYKGYCIEQGLEYQPLMSIRSRQGMSQKEGLEALKLQNIESFQIRALEEIIYGAPSLSREEFESLKTPLDPKHNKFKVSSNFSKYGREKEAAKELKRIVNEGFLQDLSFEEFQALNKEALRGMQEKGDLKVSAELLEEKLESWGQSAPVLSPEEALREDRIKALKLIIQPWFVEGLVKEEPFSNPEAKDRAVKFEDALRQYKGYSLAQGYAYQPLHTFKHRGGISANTHETSANRTDEKALFALSVIELLFGSPTLSKAEYDSLQKNMAQWHEWVEYKGQGFNQKTEGSNQEIEALPKLKIILESGLLEGLSYAEFQELNKEALRQLQQEKKIAVPAEELEARLENWGKRESAQEVTEEEISPVPPPPPRPAPAEPTPAPAAEEEAAKPAPKAPLSPKAETQRTSDENQARRENSSPKSQPNGSSSSRSGVAPAVKYGAMGAGILMVAGGIANDRAEKKESAGQKTAGENEKKGTSFSTVALCVLGAVVTGWAIWVNAAPKSGQKRGM